MPFLNTKKNELMNERKNIAWIDLLRIIACFLVVLSHCCDPFVARFDSDYETFLQGCGMGSAVRCCVPLFAMMTGVLLLGGGREESLGHFYGKRLGRLVVPLVFWSLALPLMYYAYFLVAGPTESASVDMAMFTGEMTLRKMYTFIFNFNYDTTPLWYLYMLVGLYFVIPVFRTWLREASRRDVKLFLIVWGVTLFVPYLRMAAPALGYMGNYGNMGLFGECDWNAYGSFYYVSGFIGYLVLAHYLVKYPLQWSWRKLAAIGIPMFLVGYAVTFGGYLVMNDYFPGNYAYLEIIWLFSGINVFMMTFPIFVTVQKLDIKPRPWLSRVASMTFGIYLSHFVFVQMSYDFWTYVLPEETPALVLILFNAIFVFRVTYLFVCLLSKNKVTRKLVA